MIRVPLNNKIMDYIIRIDRNRVEVSSIRLPVSLSDRLRKNSKKRSAYSSNKIEGNPLSQAQAYEVDFFKNILIALERSIPIASKTLVACDFKLSSTLT